MNEQAWIGLTSGERAILLDALSMLGKTARADVREIDALIVKLAQAEASPSRAVEFWLGGPLSQVFTPPPPVRDLDAPDGEEETTLFRNFYKCARCKYKWTDEWSAMCDDDCPQCGKRHMTPYKSEELTEDDE